MCDAIYKIRPPGSPATDVYRRCLPALAYLAMQIAIEDSQPGHRVQRPGVCDVDIDSVFKRNARLHRAVAEGAETETASKPKGKDP